MELTAIIKREGVGYVALCPELDIASQGSGVEQARDNLKEAIAFFIETADPQEILTRVRDDLFVTRIEISTNSD